MQGEIWKPIKGYDGNYYVSNYGRIKSTYHASEKFLVPRNEGATVFGWSCYCNIQFYDRGRQSGRQKSLRNKQMLQWIS